MIDRREHQSGLVDTDLVGDLRHDRPRCVVAEALDGVGPVDQPRVAPLVEADRPGVRRVDRVRSCRRATERDRRQARIGLGVSLAEPAIGEPRLREPSVGQLVQRHALIEIFADLDLLVRRAEPTGIAVQVGGVRLAYLDRVGDRPRAADEVGQHWYTVVDLLGHECLPIRVTRPRPHVELVSCPVRHALISEGGIVAGRHEDVERVGVRDVRRRVDRVVALPGDLRVVTERVDGEALGSNDPHGHLAGVAGPERVECGVGGVDPRRVGGAWRQPRDVVGHRDPGGLAIEQATGEDDVVDEEVAVSVDDLGIEREGLTGVVHGNPADRAHRHRHRESSEERASDGVAIATVGDRVGELHHRRDVHQPGGRVDGVRGDALDPQPVGGGNRRGRTDQRERCGECQRQRHGERRGRTTSPHRHCLVGRSCSWEPRRELLLCA